MTAYEAWNLIRELEAFIETPAAKGKISASKATLRKLYTIVRKAA